MDNIKTPSEVFNDCANEYQDKFMDVDLYTDSFEIFCNNIITEDAHILEIACGPGNITRYLLKKRPGFKILGIDLAPKMIELAKINNPKAEFQLMDCRDISAIPQKFDAIMCGFCLPYLSKEEAIQLINDASGLLKINGILYISTMEDDYSKSGFYSSSSGTGPMLYVHYHQADYLTDGIKKNDFKIIELRHQDYPTQDGTKITDLIIIARYEA